MQSQLHKQMRVYISTLVHSSALTFTAMQLIMHLSLTAGGCVTMLLCSRSELIPTTQCSHFWTAVWGGSTNVLCCWVL